MTSTPRSRTSVVDEEAILGGLRSGFTQPDFNYEDFVGSASSRFLSDAPDRDATNGHDRFADDGDDRIFRRDTDEERSPRARPVRDGPAAAFDQDPQDFISMAMSMGIPTGGGPSRHPSRSRALSPDEARMAPADVDTTRPGSNRYVEVQNPGQLDGDELQSHSDEGQSDGNLAFLLSASAGWGNDHRSEQSAVRQIRDAGDSIGH